MPDSQTNTSAASPAPRLLLDLGAGPAGPLHARLARALREAIRRRPAGRGHRPAAQPGAGRRAGLLAVGGHRGLRAAGRRGLPGGDGGLGNQGPAAGGGAGAARPRRRRARAPGAARHGPRPARPAGLPAARLAGRAALGRGRPAVRRPGLSRPGRPSRAAPGPGRLPGPGARRPGRPAAVTVTTGATDAIGRLCRELRRRGGRAVAVEDPGWHRIRQVVAAAGLAVVPVPVDDQGLRADRLDGPGRPDAVIISPAHQFPTGTVLSAPPPGGPAGLGQDHRRPDHRGRLRRRVPLRPAPGRRAPGRGPAVRGAGRLGQQDTVPGAGHRLDGHPARLDSGAGPPGQPPPGRRRAAGARPARVRLVRPVRRLRPPAARLPQVLPGPPRRAGRGAGRPAARGAGRRGRRGAAPAGAPPGRDRRGRGRGRGPRGGRAGGQPGHLPDRAGPAGAGARLRQPGRPPGRGGHGPAGRGGPLSPASARPARAQPASRRSRRPARKARSAWLAVRSMAAS